MHKISNAEANSLIRSLLTAADDQREYAAEHLYRATACKAVGERILTRYHTGRAEQAHALATQLRQHAQALTERTKTHTGQAVSRAALSSNREQLRATRSPLRTPRVAKPTAQQERPSAVA